MRTLDGEDSSETIAEEGKAWRKWAAKSGTLAHRLQQYALRTMALELGWSESTIRTLDRDLGLTGTEMTRRKDFKTLVADVSMGQVGAVFALKVSRLARSNLDWHRLLELCAPTATLVIDEDGCYDPSDFNDGLLLGLKGTMAQAELYFLPRAPPGR